MGCLFCGKEISTIRQLRAKEFCSDEHQNAHTLRLRKALMSLAEPEPPPAGIAGFIRNYGGLGGHPTARLITTFEHPDYPLYGPMVRALQMDPALGGSFLPFALKPANPALRHRGNDIWASTLTCSLSPSLRVTGLAIDSLSPEMVAAAAPTKNVDVKMAAPMQVQSVELSGSHGSIKFEPVASMSAFGSPLPIGVNPAKPREVQVVPQTAGPLTAGFERPPELPARMGTYGLGSVQVRDAGPARLLLDPLPAAEARFQLEPSGPLPCEAQPVLPQVALNSTRPVEASVQATRVHAASGPAKLSAAGQIAGTIAVVLPGRTVMAPALQGLADAKQLPVPFRTASGDDTPLTASALTLDQNPVPPVAAVAASGFNGVGDIRGPVSEPAYAACLRHSAMVAESAPAQLTSPALPRTTAIGSVIPSAEFLQALDEAGRPPEAGLSAPAIRPVAPVAASPALEGNFELSASIERPAPLSAAIEMRMPRADEFMPDAAKTATGNAYASPIAPFSSTVGMVALPSLPFGLAQPPVPHAADLSPDAALAKPVPSKAKPKWAVAGTMLPGFSLQPELSPITALPLAIARPATPRPLVAAPFMGVTAKTAMPHPPSTIEATGMEALFAAMPPRIADFAPVAAPLAEGWMPVHEALPPISSEEQPALGLAPAAGIWPIVLPAATPSTSAVSLEFVSGNTESLPNVSTPKMAVPSPLAAGPIPVELHIHCGRTTPSHCDIWTMPRIETALPAMTIALVPPSAEQLQPRKPAQPEAKVRTMPRPRAERRHWAQGIAAAAAVLAFLYFGSVALRSKGGETRDVASLPSGSDPIALKALPAPTGGGVTQKVQRAIAKRAKLEVGTDFRNGKDFWNGSKPSWGNGWQRHPDGYVRPGTLALLRPTMQLTDYRMEFLGQIENKGMSWAMRAHDTDNYHAMKLNVVAPGLRPIISVVRYTVVNGKRGRRIEIPLPVMVHNNRPYHVAVEVKGNRFLTSVEGEVVDTFTDDALAMGGVGFFSEGIERSRLYWVKVTNNDDLLGKICAYITGKRGGPAETAFNSGGSFDGETGQHRPIETAGALPWERIRRRRAGLGWSTSAQTV